MYKVQGVLYKCILPVISGYCSTMAWVGPTLPLRQKHKERHKAYLKTTLKAQTTANLYWAKNDLFRIASQVHWPY